MRSSRGAGFPARGESAMAILPILGFDDAGAFYAPDFANAGGKPPRTTRKRFAPAYARDVTIPPVSSPGDPGPLLRLGRNSGSRWEDIPELAGAPPQWARDVYERAIARAWRRPMMWVASAAGLAAFVLPI